MQKISPFLWFDGNAEEAVNLYVSIFDDAKITLISRYPEGSPGPAGDVMSMTFQLEGQEFLALNGGPQFTFTQAISFLVHCETQEEVDRLWDQLSEGGERQQCGWLVDRFGLSWQIIPNVLGELLGGSDPEGAQRAMQAMLQMGVPVLLLLPGSGRGAYPRLGQLARVAAPGVERRAAAGAA